MMACMCVESNKLIFAQEPRISIDIAVRVAAWGGAGQILAQVHLH
jgi:hypothetical protein